MNNTCTRFKALAVGAVLALGSLAACGPDSADAGPRTGASASVELPTVSGAVFAEHGNKICRRSSQAIGAGFGAMSTPPKPAELTAAYENMLKESYKQVGALLAVGPPTGQERALLDLLVQHHRVTETVEKRGEAAFFADQGTDPWAELVDTAVKDFGLTDCAQGE